MLSRQADQSDANWPNFSAQERLVYGYDAYGRKIRTVASGTLGPATQVTDFSNLTSHDSTVDG